LKILVLTNLYPPHQADTNDFRCEKVTESLRLRGHELRVLTSTHGMNAEQTGGNVERRMWLNGVYDHPLVTGFGDVKKLETHNHRVLSETVASFQPDVIHVWSLHGLSKSLVFALRNSRLPVVYDVADRWLAVELRQDPWLRWWNRPGGPILSKLWRSSLELTGQRNRFDESAPTRLMKGYDRMVNVYGGEAALANVPSNSIGAFRFDRLYFCSQSLKDETAQAGFRVDHAEVIRPGIATEHYVGEIKSASVPVMKLLTVARLDKQSGVLTAVKALHAVRAVQSKTTLSIYGKGDSDYVAEVRSFAATHHLPVEFLPVSNLVRDLPAVYRRHDALLHTAEWNEPFNLHVLEAMACGLPVVGTALAGTLELFRHGENALTYVPGNAEELAARILEIQTQPALRVQMAETAQQEVLTRFNETVVIDQIENHLDTSRQIWTQTAS